MLLRIMEHDSDIGIDTSERQSAGYMDRLMMVVGEVGLIMGYTTYIINLNYLRWADHVERIPNHRSAKQREKDQ